MNNRARENGSALITVLMLTALLSALISAYYLITRVELSTTKSSMESTRGFYAAEAGLNLRAQEIRQTFLGYNRPSGTSPVVPVHQMPCEAGDLGDGDFRCFDRRLGDRDVSTYVAEAAGNPTLIRIPSGERYENLNAQEYSYYIHSVAKSDKNDPQAILGMHFRSRLVPMFQFAAFYNKDLEIHPGPPMSLAGPVHSNGDLYLGSSVGGLDILGRVTTAGNLYQGRKTDMICYDGGVRVPDPGTLTAFPACPGSATVQYAQSTLDAGWNGMIETQVDTLTVPPPEAFDPGDYYWEHADLRIVLEVALDGTTSIELRDADNGVDIPGTATLTGCGPSTDRAVGTTDTFYSLREGKSIRMLEVDVSRLLDCLQVNPGLMDGKTLDDTTEAGLVWYLTVEGQQSPGINSYGVRVRDGRRIASTVGGAPQVRGLSVVTDQAAYVWGDFNAVAKRPAAVMADTINVLSAAWEDGDHNFPLGNAARNASETTVNAAFLSGTDVTGGVDGAAGQNGAYNGGLENYPRLQENWSNVTLRYRGSFVSLNAPRHVDGAHDPDHYLPPDRDWSYDVDFNNSINLPPLTPQFVYLRQEMFLRDFEL